MAKLNLGDIFEIETKKGKAYFQCMHIDKLEGEIIKVINDTYKERPENISGIIDTENYYYIGFPLKYALKQKVVEKVGNVKLPDGFRKPRYMRDKHVIKGEFKGWHIVDTENETRQLVQELTEEQKKLSPYGLVNDTYLKELIEEGWTPEKWK